MLSSTLYVTIHFSRRHQTLINSSSGSPFPINTDKPKALTGNGESRKHFTRPPRTYTKIFAHGYNGTLRTNQLPSNMIINLTLPASSRSSRDMPHPLFTHCMDRTNGQQHDDRSGGQVLHVRRSRRVERRPIPIRHWTSCGPTNTTVSGKVDSSLHTVEITLEGCKVPQWAPIETIHIAWKNCWRQCDCRASVVQTAHAGRIAHKSACVRQTRVSKHPPTSATSNHRVPGSGSSNAITP